jgi:hypothetical protein
MEGTHALDGRRFAAWVCALGLLAGFVVLPGLHAAVHAHERAHEVATTTKRPRVVVHRHGHCHAGSCHDDHGQDRAPGPRHHHEGDRDGGHGERDPAHLSVALAAAMTLEMPAPSWTAVTVEAPRDVDRPGAPARHDRRARGPPTTVA